MASALGRLGNRICGHIEQRGFSSFPLLGLLPRARDAGAGALPGHCPSTGSASGSGPSRSRAGAAAVALRNAYTLFPALVRSAGAAAAACPSRSYAAEASAGAQSAASAAIEVPVTNFAQEGKGTALLSGDVFSVPIRRDIVHRVVVWQRAKRRKGSHSTKTISEVSGTGRKSSPQKGSGHARHRSLRAPQFRGGARVHGPKPRNYDYCLPKKVRRLGLKITLSARLAEGKLVVFDSIVPPTTKTKDVAQILARMEKSRRVLFVEESEVVNEPLRRATSNLHHANVLPVKGLNVYSILQHDTLVMTRGAIQSLEERLHTPINR